jgi:hypothetical protein
LTAAFDAIRTEGRKETMNTHKDFQTEVNKNGKAFAKAAKEQISALNHRAIEAGNSDAEKEARNIIEQGPFSVTVRSDWYIPGTEEGKPAQYCILLGTGGPASRIIGDLAEHGVPESAHFEWQTLWDHWTRAQLTGEEEDSILQWAQQFYFGG